MRIIKFRGKSLLDGLWRYGSLLIINNKYYILEDNDIDIDGHNIIQISDRPTIVDKNTVRQYIGVKDKNDREIYENDIIKLASFICGTIQYDGTLHVKEHCNLHISEEISHVIEIIGNVFEFENNDIKWK